VTDEADIKFNAVFVSLRLIALANAIPCLIHLGGSAMLEAFI
jgi:hypothetical protein